MTVIKSISCFICCIYLLCSCKNPTPGVDPGPSLHNANLVVTTTHLFDTIGLMDSAVGDANLKVYDTYRDMILDENRLYERTTDSIGEGGIEGMNIDFAYVRAYHPNLGTTYDSTSTPHNTTSFLPILFY